MYTTRLYVILITLALAAGCVLIEDQNPIQMSEFPSCKNARSKGEELESYLADKKTCTGVADCASLSVGNKACGGPSAYAVYNPATVDGLYLQNLADDITTLEGQCNQEAGIISTCDMVTAPTLECTNSSCQPSTQYLYHHY